MEHIFYTNRLNKSNKSVYIHIYTAEKDPTIDLLDGAMMHRGCQLTPLQEYPSTLNFWFVFFKQIQQSILYIW